MVTRVKKWTHVTISMDPIPLDVGFKPPPLEFLSFLIHWKIYLVKCLAANCNILNERIQFPNECHLVHQNSSWHRPKICWKILLFWRSLYQGLFKYLSFVIFTMIPDLIYELLEKDKFKLFGKIISFKSPSFSMKQWLSKIKCRIQLKQ